MEYNYTGDSEKEKEQQCRKAMEVGSKRCFPVSLFSLCVILGVVPVFYYVFMLLFSGLFSCLSLIFLRGKILQFRSALFFNF